MPTVRRVAPAGATGLLVVLLLGLAASFPPGAGARTTCSYAGAPRNVLTVTVKGDAVGEIRRRGLGIAVRGQEEPLSRCTGGTPTVLNTDIVSCGSGRDRANRDKRDEISGCERSGSR